MHRCNLAFADPPFNIGYDYDQYDDRRSSDDYLGWCRKWIDEVVRVLAPNGTFWLAIGDEYAAELKVMMQQECQLTCRSWVVWYYTFGVNCKSKFSRSHAHLFHMVKDPKTLHSTRMRFASPQLVSWSTEIAALTPKADFRTIRGFFVLKIWSMASSRTMIRGTSRAWPAPSRSALVGTAARCQSSCWAASFVRALIPTTWLSIRSEAVARRWRWLRNSVASIWASNCRKNTPRAFKSVLTQSTKATNWSEHQNRWSAHRARRTAASG